MVTYNKTVTDTWVIEVCDTYLDVDFHDHCSWIVLGTIHSDYEML